MRAPAVIAFILAAGLSFAAAGHRFDDSSHAIGLVSERGGKARHPFHLGADKGLYTLIATATVLPPYRGDARVILEGGPAMNYSIYDSHPVIDLGLHHRPRFENGILYDLQPKDRLALWVVMQPAEQAGPANNATETTPPSCCADTGPGIFNRRSQTDDTPLKLAFYDTKTDKPLLTIPVTFHHSGGDHVD